MYNYYYSNNNINVQLYKNILLLPDKTTIGFNIKYKYKEIIELYLYNSTPELLKSLINIKSLNKEEFQRYTQSMIEYMNIPYEYRNKIISLLVERIILNNTDINIIYDVIDLTEQLYRDNLNFLIDSEYT
jgi:hypothetical protein